MREGWICPQCRRGVSPDVATCSHGAPLDAVAVPGEVGKVTFRDTTGLPPIWRQGIPNEWRRGPVPPLGFGRLDGKCDLGIMIRNGIPTTNSGTGDPRFGAPAGAA